MLTRVPDYYEAFHCLAGACPHTCCEKWEVVIDPETARRYGTVPGPLGERLRAAMAAKAGIDVRDIDIASLREAIGFTG